MTNINLEKTLFVCTGNVYRSFIAEKVFNAVQNKMDNNYIANSCGTNLLYKAPHKDVVNYCTTMLRNTILGAILH